jgi:outer membrane protein TolC
MHGGSSVDREPENESGILLRGELGLLDAVKLSLAHNKTLRATLEDKKIARGRIMESYSQAFPRLSAIGSYTRLDEVRTMDFGDESVSMGQLNNYSIELQVKQPIYHGGATGAGIRAARVFAHMSDENVRSQVQKTIYEVASAYYDTLLARHLYTVNEEAVQSAEAQLEDVKHKRNQGVASEFDVLRVQVDVSNFRAEMIQQRNRTHLAKTLLLKSMGVSQESEVTLSDELTYEPVSAELEEIAKIALHNRPDLLQAELAVRLQEEAVRVAKSKYYPQLDAVFSENWERPDPHSATLDEWGDAWIAGLTLSWPLFDSRERKGRLIQERASLRKRRIQLLDAREGVLLDIRQVTLSLQDAEEFVESQQLNLERASEALRLVEAGYREGINTQVEVTDARAALSRAKGLYYQAVYSHAVARLELQRAMGILGPRAGESRVPEELHDKPGRIEDIMDSDRDTGQPASSE